MPPIPRLQVAATAVVALVVVALGMRWIQGQAPPASGGGARGGAERAAAGGGVQIQRARGSPAVVHVAGAVRRPGVYRLPADARVGDAVRRAGGAAPRGDPNAVNLAARVADGQQVVVPRRAPAPAAAPDTAGAASDGAAASAASPAATAAPVSLNTATLEQLDALDGVGPVTAQKILDFRRERGGFRSVDDLAQVPGIGPKRLATLRPKVQV